MWIPTIYDFGALFGSFGLFFTLFLLYIRVMPAISIAEVKPILSYGRDGGEHGHH
jgi:molybdopterin-containing oxidoreductase family membrane subunit